MRPVWCGVNCGLDGPMALHQAVHELELAAGAGEALHDEQVDAQRVRTSFIRRSCGGRVEAHLLLQDVAGVGVRGSDGPRRSQRLLLPGGTSM